MAVYEALMLMISFGIFIVSLIGLIIAIVKRMKK